MKLIAHADGRFETGGATTRCALGRSGVIAAADKREGDGASPIGVWTVRRVLWRADRLEKPVTPLPLHAIERDDGWCDAPDDPAYNRPVRLPWPTSHEVMTREDGLYDVVVVLSHNDDPPVPGLGSAIFLHCASPDYKPTEGCVAIAREALVELLKNLNRSSTLEIRG